MGGCLNVYFFLQHKIEREWILNVLEEGISDGHCYDLCDQQGIFQSLLGFSSSPLCDEQSQVHTVGITVIQHTSSEVRQMVDSVKLFKTRDTKAVPNENSRSIRTT